MAARGEAEDGSSAEEPPRGYFGKRKGKSGMPHLNPLRNAFSGEPKTENADTTNSGKGGLTGEEVANRLYPKPAEAPRVGEFRPEPAPATDNGPAATELTLEAEQPPAATSEPEAVVPASDGPAPVVLAPEPPPSAAPSAGMTGAPSASTTGQPATRSVSVISRDAVFDGNYMSEGDVTIEGEMRGDITCKGHVLIAEGATVNAKLGATSVTVAGRLSGEVTCSERFEALPTAKITSQIASPRLIIQDGAVLDGQVRMQVPA